MFLRRQHISGQAISRGADFNDQSHDDVVAAAHKNVSLGCRSISAETYRRGNASDSWFLGTTRSAIVSSLSGHFCAFIAFRSSKKKKKHETDRPPNNAGQLKGIVQRSMHCSPDHRSNYLGNPIYPSRAASWLPASLLGTSRFSLVSGLPSA